MSAVLRAGRRREAEGWIDVHAHFSMPKTAAELQATLKMMHAGCFHASRPFEWSVEGALEHMNCCGIAMQLLSNIPRSLDALRASNDHGASIVARHPSRFGLLAALPTDDPGAALSEIRRTDDAMSVDGFAVTCRYNEVYLGDARLAPVWRELDRRHASVFVHPDAYASPSLGRPSALLEVAFETARTVVDMLYAGIFREHPNIRFVVAHCGGALPALSGRLALLGAQDWVPNPKEITRAEIISQLGSLFFDTAAAASSQSLRPAMALAGSGHLLYGSDCGVPCSSDETLSENLRTLLDCAELDEAEVQRIGRRALEVFPKLAERLGRLSGSTVGATRKEPK
jgi:predicted TIM-barrel fold metal-dependent hydrolase